MRTAPLSPAPLSPAPLGPALLVAALVVTGCATTVPGRPVAGGAVPGDRELVVGYFEAANAAAEEGSAAQERFFTDTQHPDFRGDPCGLDGVVLVSDPALTTLRVDEDWSPDGSEPPRGTTYAVAVTVAVEQDAVEIGTQIGSQRVVVLDGTAYGFVPCPS